MPTTPLDEMVPKFKTYLLARYSMHQPPNREAKVLLEAIQHTSRRFIMETTSRGTTCMLLRSVAEFAKRSLCHIEEEVLWDENYQGMLDRMLRSFMLSLVVAIQEGKIKMQGTEAFLGMFPIPTWFLNRVAGLDVAENMEGGD